MRPAVENVHHGNREAVRIHAAEVTVHGNVIPVCGGTCGGKRDGKDRVRTELAFVVRSVNLTEKTVHLILLRRGNPVQRGRDHVPDVIDRIGHTPPPVPCRVPVPLFMRFKYASGRA